MINKSLKQFKVEVVKDNLISLTLENADSLEELRDLRNWAKKVTTIVYDLYKKTGKKIIVITDIKNLKKYNPQAFAILTDLMKSNEPYVLKSATFGGSKYILFAQDILLTFSGRKNFKAFKTKEEALIWLNS